MSRLLVAALSATLVAAGPVPVDPDLPSYRPQPFTVPKDAGYVMRDGSLQIVGAHRMDVAFANLNALFVKSHPGTRFTMSLHGAATAIGGLYTNVSAFAPNSREFWPAEVAAFKMTFGYEPTAIRVVHGAFRKVSKGNPIAVFVHPANPLDKLTTDQVARIFSAGAAGGDLTRWGQVGLTADWAARPIHPIGPSATSGNIQGVAIMMKQVYFGDRPYAAGYEEVGSTAAILKRVSEEPSGIGFASFDGFEVKEAPRLKILAIAEKEGGYYSNASREDILARRYPYLRDIYFYVNRAPGKPLDPFVKEYLRMVLSKEGQQAMTAEEDGFLPLSAKEAAAELAKLE